MKKKFTPEQVKNGKVAYTFDAFLKELWEDIESILSTDNSYKISKKEMHNGNREKNLREVFVFVYRICYLAAVNQPKLKGILERADSENKDIMKKTLNSNKENIALLRAIFSREISRKLEQGLTKKQAFKATLKESKEAFANWEN